MPLAIDPKQTFDIVLSSDAGQEIPPTFVYRYYTGREVIAAQQFLDRILSADAATLNSGDLERLYEMLAVKFVQVRDLYEADGVPLADILTPAEAFELLMRLCAQRPDLEDKKKYASPSPSATGPSATPAEVPESAPSTSDPATDMP